MNIVINNLQEDNARLNSKCSYLENRIELLESTLSRLDQYGGRKKTWCYLVFQIHWMIMILKHSYFITVWYWRQFGATWYWRLSKIFVNCSTFPDISQPPDTEDCHRTGLTDKNNSKETIMQLVNCRFCEKTPQNRKK